MAEFGNMSLSTHELAYDINFGSMPHKTVYLDRLAGAHDEKLTIDRREEMKAHFFKSRPEIAWERGSAFTKTCQNALFFRAGMKASLLNYLLRCPPVLAQRRRKNSFQTS